VEKRAGARAYDSWRRARKERNDYRGSGLFGQLFLSEKKLALEPMIVGEERGRSAMTIEAAAYLDSFFEVEKRAGARAYDSWRRARRSAMTIEAAAYLDSFFEVEKRAGAQAYDSWRRAGKERNDYRGGGLFGQLFRSGKKSWRSSL
jgi:hypothetical protein